MTDTELSRGRKRGRKTNAERAEIAHNQAQQEATAQQEAKHAERYAAQEAKRATRQQIDQNSTLRLLVVLSAVSFIGSAVLTADGTIAASEFAELAFVWMGWLYFAALELSALTFMLFYLVIGSRNEGGEGLWFKLLVLTSALMVGANVFHVLDVYEYDWTNPQMWAGIVLRSIVPLFFVLISKGLSTVVFAKAVKP